jgi:tetratricopeptide (TPR) repeat protein
MSTRATLALVAALLAGCASAPRPRAGALIPRAELVAGRPLGLTAEPAGLVDEKEVLAATPEMRAFVDEHVSRRADRALKLRQLTQALIHAPGFRLHYDETTRTAAATFKARRGNCLSFSSMFVALAREAGLRASFQEVDTPADWSFRDDAFVLNRHVNVLVDLGRQGEHVVDFNVDDVRTSYDRRSIRDTRARAHYYNNIAVERMQVGDTASALGYLGKALANDETFSPAWTNLGILYVRNGRPAEAEACYLQALGRDGADPVAMSNLSWLYERQGDAARAAAYRKRVLAHRDRNPYYHYRLAREAFRTLDYDAAIGHLKRAVRVKRNDDQFYFLLSLSHLKKGDARAARRYLARAEELAATDTLKRRYASKMEALLRTPRDKPAPP